MGKGTESRRRGSKPAKPTSVLNAVWQRKKLGKYNLLAILGKGAMGGVFRAEDDLLKRQVALKVLPQRIGDQGGNAWGVEQFIREARSAAQIEHPNVTRIYEIGEEHGYYYIAMELVEGGDLETKVKKEGPLDPELACKLISQCASGLHFAHNMGVVHRDVKPANVMLTKDGQAKLTDFGLARIDDPDDEFSLPTEMVGTPKYVAPEVCLGQAATSLSDVYSLGATMWFILTGEAPFNEKDPRRVMAMQVKAPLPDLTEIRPDLPPSLINVVYRSLAKKAEDRFKSCEEMAEVLSNHGDDDELSSLAFAIDDANTGFSQGATANTSMTSRSGAKRSGAGGKPIRQPREVTRKKQNNNAIIIGIVVGVVLLLVVVGGIIALFSSGGKNQPADPPQFPENPILQNQGGTQTSTDPTDPITPDLPKDPDPVDPDPKTPETDWANEKPVRTYAVSATRMLHSVKDNGRIYQFNGAIDGMSEIGGNYRLNLFIRGRGIRVEYPASNASLVSAINAKLGASAAGLPKSADGTAVEVLGRLKDVNGMLIVTLESADQIKRADADDIDNDPDSVAKTPAGTNPIFIPVNGRIGTTGEYGKAHFIPDYYIMSTSDKLKELAKLNKGLAQVAVVGRVTFAGKHNVHPGRNIVALEGQDPNDPEALLLHFKEGEDSDVLLARFGAKQFSDLQGKLLQINGKLTFENGRMLYDPNSNDTKKRYWSLSEPGQTFFLGALPKQIFEPANPQDEAELKRLAARGDNVAYCVIGQVTAVQKASNGWYRIYMTNSTTDQDFFVSINNDKQFQDMLTNALRIQHKDANYSLESLKGRLVAVTGTLSRTGDGKHLMVASNLGQVSVNGKNQVFNHLLLMRGKPILVTETAKLEQAKKMQVLVNLAVDSKGSVHKSGSRWLVRLDNDVVLAVADGIADELIKKLGLSSKNQAYGKIIVSGQISTSNKYGKYTVWIDRVAQISRATGGSTTPNTNTPTNPENNTPQVINSPKDWLTATPNKRYQSDNTTINADLQANPGMIFSVSGELKGSGTKYLLGNVNIEFDSDIWAELKKRMGDDKLSLNDKKIEVLSNSDHFNNGNKTIAIRAIEQIVSIDGKSDFRTAGATKPDETDKPKAQFVIPDGHEKIDLTVDNLRLDLFRKITNQSRDDFAVIGEVTAIERIGRYGWVMTLKDADPTMFRVTMSTSAMSRLIRAKKIEKAEDLKGKSIMALGRLENKMKLDGKTVPRLIVKLDKDLSIAE